ncbi:MAG TPA: mechanosensitive ion channel domain-containing protein [Steroidobacteraceae bacterium]|nr:mechanosensitive ion channel domain-containing protein [Steroidobacteraceae bacterium]
MSSLHKMTAAVLAVLLLAAGYAWWVTTQPATPVRAAAAQPAGAGMPVIDQNTLLTARRLARLANTAEEQPLAQAAVEAAAHELDLSFAAALRYVETHPPALSLEASRIQQKLLDRQTQLAAATEEVKRLTAALAPAADADKPAIQDRLDLAQSQVQLLQDEVTEANNDLLQAGGNLHQRIQLMQQEHEAAQRSAAATPAAAPSALASFSGMVGEVRQWLALRDKQRWLSEAQHDAAQSAAQLAAQRQEIATELADYKARIPEFTAHGPRSGTGAKAPAGAAPPPKAAPAAGAPRPSAAPQSSTPANASQAAATAPPAASLPAAAEPTTLLELTRRIAAVQHRLMLRDERISARQRLTDIYGRWEAVVASQARGVLHECLAGAAIVLVVLLLLLFVDRSLEQLLARARVDRRQLETLRSVVRVALQIVGVVFILIVLMGPPGQLGTMLGLAGAGLTVALKDFIVAFIGWFALMGRNGMRVGDWVEINGVSGEVVELNMFHTVLLETGNWTDTGHPTGRRVTFTNSFAIEGHYFNFSTSGQWLWDELSVVVPYGRDPQAVAAAIQKEVTEATAKDATQAEEEWRRASRGRGAGFTARPGIAVRPASGGVEIAVRYVTRASERLALRARLYQSAVQLLSAHA